MDIKILSNPLFEGEPWESEEKRVIKICPDGDFGDTLYFGIHRDYGGGETANVILADLFLTPAEARQIAEAILEELKKVKPL